MLDRRSALSAAAERLASASGRVDVVLTRRADVDFATGTSIAGATEADGAFSASSPGNVGCAVPEGVRLVMRSGAMSAAGASAGADAGMLDVVRACVRERVRS
jgi:hypothetical protein